MRGRFRRRAAPSRGGYVSGDTPASEVGPLPDVLTKPATAPDDGMDWVRFDRDADDRGYVVSGVRWESHWGEPTIIYVTLRRHADGHAVTATFTDADRTGPPVWFWDRVDEHFAAYDAEQDAQRAREAERARRRAEDPLAGPIYIRVTATDHTGRQLPVTVGPVDEKNAIRIDWYGKHLGIPPARARQLPAWLWPILRNRW